MVQTSTELSNQKRKTVEPNEEARPWLLMCRTETSQPGIVEKGYYGTLSISESAQG